MCNEAQDVGVLGLGYFYAELIDHDEFVFACCVCPGVRLLRGRRMGPRGNFVPISEGGTYTVDCDAGNPFSSPTTTAGLRTPKTYSNQNYTITLCPSTPGDAVQVNFLSFDLQTNANPNNNDVLLAYNGDSPAADLVGIGAGNSFVGVSITASIDNPTGCVTFSFNVNNNALVGTWMGG